MANDRDALLDEAREFVDIEIGYEYHSEHDAHQANDLIKRLIRALEESNRP